MLSSDQRAKGTYAEKRKDTADYIIPVLPHNVSHYYHI